MHLYLMLPDSLTRAIPLFLGFLDALSDCGSAVVIVLQFRDPLLPAKVNVDRCGVLVIPPKSSAFWTVASLHR